MTFEIVLIAFVLIAGFYLAWNIGANDVANAMGTSVGSGALTLKQAVMLAAVLEFSGAFFFGSHVSETIQKGIINLDFFTNSPLIVVYGMLASLLAAGIWLQVASYYGWPVSTTHSIVGAIVGFGAVVGGIEAVYWKNVLYIVSSWILSPLCGAFFSYLIFNVLRKQIFYTSNPIQSAKKLTPLLVFIVIAILTLIMLYKGLENTHLDFSFFQAFLISITLGSIAACIGYLCVRNIQTFREPVQLQPAFDPDAVASLDKARKHLQRVQVTTSGELHYQLSLLIEEVQDISHSFRQTIDDDVMKLEFKTVEKIFAYLQIMSACLMAFAHGANDVANAIGPLSASISILTTGLVSVDATVPTWALALGGVGIVVGLATWGWRVIETIGKKITELTPTRGFAAEFGAAITIVLASRFGLPISTTHTLVGSVIGVGLARGIEALNLSTMRDILISWIVTVPAGAAIAVTIFYILRAVF